MSDGALEVDLRTPVEMGGGGGGTNPEQLFAVGYAACFESAIGVAARRGRQEISDVAIDSEVMLLPTEDRGFKLAVASNHRRPHEPAVSRPLSRTSNTCRRSAPWHPRGSDPAMGRLSANRTALLPALTGTGHGLGRAADRRDRRYRL